MFTIDGIEWDVHCKIQREAEIKASDISGMMLDGSIFWDILGTYMSYDISLDMPLHDKGKYAALYEMLTAPVAAHICVLPYNNGTIELTARVESPADVYVETEGGFTYWKGLRFTLTAIHPTKQQTLAEAIARGMSPMPPAEAVSVGDTYTMTANGWVKVEDE